MMISEDGSHRMPQKWIISLLSALIGLFSNLTTAQSLGDPENDTQAGEQTSAATNQPRLQFPPAQKYFNWLSEQVERHQVQWLEADEPFFSLYAERRAGPEMGAVILLPGTGQHAGAADILKSIHRYLPDFGWHCLTLSLPHYVDADKPSAMDSVHSRKIVSLDAADDGDTSAAAEENADASDEAPNVATTNDKSTGMAQDDTEGTVVPKRISSAIAFLQNKRVQNITLIGLGTSASQAASFIDSAETAKASVSALILIDAENEQAEMSTNFHTALKKLKLPILDIIYASDLHSTQKAQQRKRQVKGDKKDAYQQLRLPAKSPQRGDQPNQLAKRVRGWLATH